MRRHKAHQLSHLSWHVAVAAFCAAFLAACGAIPIATDQRGNSNSGGSPDNSTTRSADDGHEPDVFEKIRNIDLLPRYPAQVAQDENSGDKRKRSAIYLGTDDPPVQPATTGAAAPGATANSGGYDLNFENTPVASVAKVVLGDILGVGYIIDPRVQGTVSLSSGRPVPKSDVLFVLENALRLGGVALVRDATGYRLIPQGEAAGTGALDPDARGEPGYGISVVSLQYISAPTLLKLVDSFASKPGMVRADAGRNLILIQGTGSERRNAIDLALSFDVDWMRGQSVGIFPVQNSNPEPIIAELEKIMSSGEGGVSQNLVNLQPITRMNAVLAVTTKPELLRRIDTWIHRLDVADTGGSSVHVYHLKYGEARQVAKVLNDIFGSGGSSNSTSLDSASDQIAPGSGISNSTSSSPASRLGAGSSNQQSSTGFGSSSQPGGFGGNSNTGSGIGTNGNQLGGGQANNGLDTHGSGGNLFDSHGGGSNGGSNSGVLQGVRITPDTANNTLLIYGSQEHYSIIQRTLRQLDRPQLQVGIDTTVAEITLNDNLSYGVQFFLQSQNFGLPADKGSILNTTATGAPGSSTSGGSSLPSAFLNRAFPGLNFLLGPEVQPNMILDALHAVTDVKVLSNPSVVVVDNQVATLQVGDQVPISTGSANVLSTSNTIVNTIDYRDTGIILSVVPRINANGNVRLEIQQEISNVAPSSTSGSSGTPNLTPTVTQRKVRSSVVVASGQTVLLGGLISQNDTGGRSGIPVLDEIPGLGVLFSSTNKQRQRTELIILIRPQIIRDSVDAHFVAEELRTKLRGTIGAVRSGTSDATKYR